MDEQHEWQLEGDYFEACNCESTCPRIFLANPDEGDCQATLGWHVRRGHFGTTSLDDLNVTTDSRSGSPPEVPSIWSASAPGIGRPEGPGPRPYVF